MSYKIRRKKKGKNKNHSLINKLKKENKIDDLQFENISSNFGEIRKY